MAKIKAPLSGIWELVDAGSLIDESTLIANPNTTPSLTTATTGGSLAAATYYVKYTWVNANGETLASPEASITTTGSTSTITVTIPSLPTNVTSANIYISTATGTETKQGSTTSTTYTQSAALATGLSLPIYNTTEYKVTASKIGDLSTLQTTDKSSLTGAINSVQNNVNTTVNNSLQSFTTKINELERENAHLLAYADIDGRALGNTGKFYDLMDGRTFTYNAGKIDTTKSNSTTALSIGATSIPVASATGFAIGQEITVFDDVNLERPTITAIAGNTLTVTALTKAYKINATVCRSSVIVDTVNKVMKFGGWSSTATYDRSTPVSVVGSAYNTSGSGRKLVRLSNGWLVAVMFGTNTIYFYKSTDNGSTWTLLTSKAYPATSVSLAIVSSGTKIYLLSTVTSTSYTTVDYATFDATTVSSTFTFGSSVDTGQTAFSGCSLTIDTNGKLWATWSSKNSTYSNSFNIRVSSSTDGGVTWATPTQLTTQTSLDCTNPCVVIKSNGYPIVFYNTVTTGNRFIYNGYYNGSNWIMANTVYNGSTYDQSNPSAVVDSSGVIHVAWHGTDATDTTANNLRYSKSTDGGATWSAMTKLTSGNTYGQAIASITADKNNNLYVLFHGVDSAVTTSYQNVRKIVYNGTAWGSIVTLTNNTTSSAVSASTLANYTEFTDPLVIYQDNQAGAVKFRGVWSDTSTSQVLVEDVRYNITPPTNASELVTWLSHDTDANYSVAGSLSLVASGATESYASMTKTSQNLAGNITEDQFYGKVATAQAKGTVRFTLTRTATSNTSNVKKVLGAIS
jgi:hypothetical protein